MITKTIKLRYLIFSFICQVAVGLSQPIVTNAPPPEVASTSPQGSAVGVPINTSILATFDSDMDATTINQSSFLVYTNKSGRVEGSVSYAAVTRTATFVPNSNFLPGEVVTAIITKEVRASGGKKLNNGFVWNFTIQSLQGTSQFIGQNLNIGPQLRFVATGDFDADHDLDLAIIQNLRSANQYRLIVALNNGNATFSTLSPMVIDHDARPVFCGDLTGDGLIDLLMIKWDASRIYVYENVGQGSFQLHNSYLIDNGLRYAMISDFDGDGYLDVGAVRKSRLVGDDKGVTFLHNDGTGQLSITNYIRVQRNAQCIFGRDWTSDGLVDFAVTSNTHVQVFKNNGGEKFVFVEFQSWIHDGGDPETAITEDLNGDLNSDLAISNLNFNNVYIHLQLDNFQFDQHQAFSTGIRPVWTDVADINADNQMDLLTANKDDGTVSALLNNGAAKFWERVDLGAGETPQVVTTGDYNGDGAIDIVAIDAEGDVFLYLNDVHGNVPPEAPTLIAPSNQGFVDSRSPTLVWNIPADANNDLLSFRVVIDSDDPQSTGPYVFNSSDNATGFNPTPPVPAGSGSESFTLPVALPLDTYWWEVQAYDGYSYSPTSARWIFHFDEIPPEILGIEFPDAVYQNRWVNTVNSPTTSVRIRYTESYADSAILTTIGLGGPFYATPIPSGTNQSVDFVIPAGNVPDGHYDVQGTVIDQAGGRSQASSWVGVDGHSPTGAVVSVPDTTNQVSFPVVWSEGGDGDGSGLSGLYSVWVQIDGDNWTLWRDKLPGTTANYDGANGHQYGFEAVAWDNVDNMETRTWSAEAVIVVDISAFDTDPPAPPLDLTAGGSSPSPWQISDVFVIRWQNPYDVSGITRSYWKINAPPTGPADFDLEGPPVGPIDFNWNGTETTQLYGWLEDSKGNSDYNNWASVQLRRDPTPPAVQNLVFVQPTPPYEDGGGLQWYSQALVTDFTARLSYSEQHPDSAVLDRGGLGPPISNSNPPAGNNMAVDLVVELADAPNGVHPLTGTVIDSAGSSDQISKRVGLDGIAPTGTIATAPEVSETLTFVVSWSGGVDFGGSGLAGLYDIRLQVDNGVWTSWLTKFSGSSASFTGSHLHTYSFEAAARDNVDNLETFTGVAEATVLIDTTADDIQPPAPPINLTAGGSSPSPWQALENFQIDWIVPNDESGVVKSWWKFGSAPVSNSDSDGTGPADGPVWIAAPAQGLTWLYVWLQDRQGNVDFHNWSRVLLRFDNTTPVIHQMEMREPNPSYVDSDGRGWYRQDEVASFTTRINYTEAFPEEVKLNRAGLGEPIVLSSPSAGNNVDADFDVAIAGRSDGRYELLASVKDSVGQADQEAKLLGLDRTPPSGSIASVSEDTVVTETFMVSWSAGSDGQGSGLSGHYAVRVREDNGIWQVWLPNHPGLSSNFNGTQGHTYSFEAAAYDNLDISEVFTGTAEAVVVVDTLANDRQAPPPPINLVAGGSNPSPWQSSNVFIVNWDIPDDESGISHSYWKLGAPPANNSDYDDTGLAAGPLEIALAEQGSTPLYVWLEDGRGNVNFENYARVLLRYDAAKPTIHSVNIQSSGPRYVATDGRIWLDQSTSDQLKTQVVYTEALPDRAILKTHGLGPDLVQTNIPAGENVTVDFTLAVGTAQDGTYDLETSILDLAGKEDVEDVLLGLDSVAPIGATATGPDTSASTSFTISWSGDSDGNGSGLSGEYDLWFRQNGHRWQKWLDKYKGVSATFVGEQGSTYDFEALAYDNLNHVEQQTHLPEATVLVDTLANDKTAPAAPVDMTVNGLSPRSAWTANPKFTIDWTVPFDESGIKNSFWKLGLPPVSNDDFQDEGPSNGPLYITLQTEGAVWLYVWLADGRGNIDFHNWARVQLRYDATEPTVSGFKPLEPGFGENWYNQKFVSVVPVLLRYSEARTDKIIITCEELGLQLEDANPQSGNTIQVEYDVPIAGAADGAYEVWAAVVDSAGNSQTSSLEIRLDASPPTGTTATSPDTSSEEDFWVTWSGGSDGLGSGLSGNFGIRYRVNNDSWVWWYRNFNGDAALFPGEQKKWYYFEVAAYDNLGNFEELTTIAECSTFVDTTSNDQTAPGPPINLLANDANPSFWQKNKKFKITWQLPEDPSDIAESFYKLGDPPTDNSDYEGTGSGGGPLVVKATKEGGQWLYVWLSDGRGNADYNNYSRVRLRYDATEPIITRLSFLDPGYGENWFNQSRVEQAVLQIDYGELHTDSVTTWSVDLNFKKVLENPVSGGNVSELCSLTVAGHDDGSYVIYTAVIDSAGNRFTQAINLSLDSSPPTGSVATSPDTSNGHTFQVNIGGGSDSAGVGLSGVYDIWVKRDDLEWEPWQVQLEGRSARFTGEHGHTYAFEAAAWDFLGNLEPLLNQAETETYIDTTTGDFTAPMSPDSLTASGQNPSPWQNTAEFEINWVNPSDPSGIAKSLIKLGSAPEAPADTSQTSYPTPPIFVEATEEDGQPLFLWLEDGSGNTDYSSAAEVLLRWDATAPVLDSLVLADPIFDRKWYNPKTDTSATFQIYYTEKHPDSLFFTADGVIVDPILATPDSGVNKMLEFELNLKNLPDSLYALRVSLSDKASNFTVDSLNLGVDSTPPLGTVASSPERSSSTSFVVSWDGVSSDRSGSGLSGLYDVKVKIDGGEWQPWLVRYQGNDSTFHGENGHQYAFEAAAWDNVNNRERLSGEAESSTVVDTTFADTQAPDSPKNISVDGENPSRWQNEPVFALSWTNPPDPSGISKSYYKIGNAPTSNDDTTGTASGTPPIVIELGDEGAVEVFLWLADGQGNLNYQSAQSVLLRYDNTPPTIDSSFVANAQFNHRWINPDSTDEVVIRTFFSEEHPDSIFVNPGVAGSQSGLGEFEGNENFVDFNLDITNIGDGCYPIYLVLRDSANNSVSDSITVCIDGTPPHGARANSPEMSLQGEFSISWLQENAGDDGQGSGLSGLYDVRLKIDEGEWQNWLKKYPGHSVNYVGVIGHTYKFEVAAWDNVMNREPFIGQPESSTRVDTAFTDLTAPPPPVELTAQGGNPSPWQNDPQFNVMWENPIDPSGILLALYKLGAAPLRNDDTTGTASNTGPISVQVTKEDGEWLFVWLMDGKGNVDVTNADSILLRYDTTSPVIDTMLALYPGYEGNWYNQNKRSKVPLQIVFSERHPHTVSVTVDELEAPEPIADLVGGDSAQVELEIQISGATDGAYKIYCSVSDSAGNVSAPDSITIHLDGTPPLIAHQARGGAVVENEALEVVAIITDNYRIVDATLNYRLGGARTAESVAMTATDDSTFSAIIPAEYLSSRGLEYTITASDGIVEVRSPSQNAPVPQYIQRVRIQGPDGQGLRTEMPQPFGNSQHAYRLFSVPAEADDPRAVAILEDDFGPYDRKRWRFYQYVTQTGEYEEYPNTAGFDPWRAFWLITSVSDVYIDSGPAISTPTGSNYTIVLRRGWNDVGCPFNFEIEWEDIVKATGDTVGLEGPYAYEDQWLIPAEVKTMEPWHGYSFYAHNDDMSLVVPPKEARSDLLAKATFAAFPDAAWAIRLSVTCQEATDASNYIGYMENATVARDRGVDFIEPPLIGSYISLYFPHHDWESFTHKYTTDFRQNSDQGDVWDFEVVSDIHSATAQLVVKPSESFPSNFQLHLVDLDANLVADLAHDSTYAFWLADNNVRQFKLIVGDVNYMKDAEDLLPQEIIVSQLLQNYPNPFNDLTVIGYELSEAEHIELSVYNLLAQRVRTLFVGFQEKGYHQARWDGHDDVGKELGTGIYVLRLDTSSFSATRKMIYIR